MIATTLEKSIGSFAKFFSTTTLILSYAPLAWTLALFTFAARARLHLGHWPSAHNPDPKYLPFTEHYQFLVVAMFAMLLASAIYFGLVLVSHNIVPKKIQHLSLIAFFSGWTLIVLQVVLKPIDFVDWFLD